MLSLEMPSCNLAVTSSTRGFSLCGRGEDGELMTPCESGYVCGVQFGGGVRLRVRRGDGDGGGGMRIGGGGSLMGLLFVSCKGLTGRFVNNCFLGLLCGLEV